MDAEVEPPGMDSRRVTVKISQDLLHYSRLTFFSSPTAHLFEALACAGLYLSHPLARDYDHTIFAAIDVGANAVDLL